MSPQIKKINIVDLLFFLFCIWRGIEGWHGMSSRGTIPVGIETFLGHPGLWVKACLSVSDRGLSGGSADNQQRTQKCPLLRSSNSVEETSSSVSYDRGFVIGLFFDFLRDSSNVSEEAF